MGCQAQGPMTAPIAAWTGNAVWLREWLKAGGNANATDENGKTLLYLSTGPKGSYEVTKLLLEAGADPNLCKAGGYSPLMNAALWSDLEGIKILLQYGADPCYKSADGKNAYDIVMAIQPPNQVVISFLAEQIKDKCGNDDKNEF